MARKGARKFKKQDILDAIIDSAGNISLVARRVGCSRRTMENYKEQDEDYRLALEEARETFKDAAINKLQQAVMEGNLTAIIFYLKTQAKDRGFIEKQEVLNSFDQPFVMTQEQAESVYHKRQDKK